MYIEKLAQSVRLLLTSQVPLWPSPLVSTSSSCPCSDTFISPCNMRTETGLPQRVCDSADQVLSSVAGALQYEHERLLALRAARQGLRALTALRPRLLSALRFAPRSEASR